MCVCDDAGTGYDAVAVSGAVVDTTLTVGTEGRIVKFGATDLADSVMFEDTGKIGVGTIAPDATLEIAGLTKVWSTDTPGACTVSTIEASIYYDASLDEMCYCNGTNWVQFDGGGNCISGVDWQDSVGTSWGDSTLSAWKDSG